MAPISELSLKAQSNLDQVHQIVFEATTLPK